jgi:hypothetical protein
MEAPTQISKESLGIQGQDPCRKGDAGSCESEAYTAVKTSQSRRCQECGMSARKAAGSEQSQPRREAEGLQCQAAGWGCPSP